MVFYTIAQPDEYLAITGAGVRTVKIAKKGFIWPMQKVSPPTMLLETVIY